MRAVVKSLALLRKPAALAAPAVRTKASGVA